MIYTVQAWIFIALYLLVFVMAVVALLDAVRRPAAAFVNGGKRTKGFWAAVLGVATAVSFIALPPLRAGLDLLVIAAAVAAIVYWVDVRPAVAPYSGRGGRGPGRGGW